MQEQRSACDSCRRRKVRCDSAQPCRRCVDSGVQCTYGNSLHRGQGTHYVRSLEQQVAELQQQLQAAGQIATEDQSTQDPPIDLLVDSGDDLIVQQPAGTRIYRFSAALNILRTIADTLNVGLMPASASASPGLAMVEAIDLPLEIPPNSTIDWLDVVLPTQPEFHRLISCAIDKALVAHHCFDRQAFNARVDELYNTRRTRVVDKNKPFMSLVYAALALGERYGDKDEGNMKQQDVPIAYSLGFQYFRASRCITHADAEPCTLDHVLARTLQARYLLSLSHVSEAHATICKGIAVATHIGLHFDDSALHTRYTSDELDERRFAFAVLYMMDIYLSFILGLPSTSRYAHPNQTLALRKEDIHDRGQSLLEQDPFSPLAETVMAQKMFHIYAKILDHQSESDTESWVASHWITDIQQDFSAWEAMVPNLPEDPSASRQLLGQLTLRMHYAGAQILLYAPCIHHLGRERSDPNFNPDGFEYGSNCVRAAAQAVLLLEILEAQRILNGALWMNGFVLTLAASILTYFVIYSKTRVTVDESKSAILKAGRMLASLGQTNVANKRVYDSLSPFVDIVLGQP